jgi:hypothetical protein
VKVTAAMLASLRRMALANRFEPGLLRIIEGRCPINATSAVRCMFCVFGHATECHHPFLCDEARCNHYNLEVSINEIRGL